MNIIKVGDIVRIKDICFCRDFWVGSHKLEWKNKLKGKLRKVHPFRDNSSYIFYTSVEASDGFIWTWCNNCMQNKTELVYRPGTDNAAGLAIVLFTDPDLLLKEIK